MNPQSTLKILIGEFQDKLKLLNHIVDRNVQFPDAPNKIKVAIGMRRTGKTYFLYQKILHLIVSGVPKSQILYINFEDDRLMPLDEQKLAKLIDAFYSIYPENHEKKCYFFLDEIQNVTNWSIVIRRLHDSKNVEIFLTGSSAKLLSKEIATSLRGRSLAVEVWPYSFSEFLRAKKIQLDLSLYDKKTEDTLSQFFQSYLSSGGFPEVILFNPDIRQKTLQEYIDIAVFRDIIERHNVKHPTIIKYMILSMLHNVSKPFSINKFYNDLKSQGYQINKDALYEYADHIEDAYLAFSVPLYSKSIRKVQINPKKSYAIDTGIVRAVTLDFETDLGKLFENIVFLDLKRQNCKVNYFLTLKNYEIDFLIQTPRGQRKLFQVVWNMTDKNTMEREQRALQAGSKELGIDGEIITLDSYLSQGIKLD